MGGEGRRGDGMGLERKRDGESKGLTNGEELLGREMKDRKLERGTRGWRERNDKIDTEAARACVCARARVCARRRETMHQNMGTDTGQRQARR